MTTTAPTSIPLLTARLEIVVDVPVTGVPAVCAAIYDDPKNVPQGNHRPGTPAETGVLDDEGHVGFDLLPGTYTVIVAGPPTFFCALLFGADPQTVELDRGDHVTLHFDGCLMLNCSY